MFNRNIDFNAALNTGDLDEAARIAGDASAAEETWMTEDANSAAELAAEKVQERHQAELDRIDELEEAEIREFERSPGGRNRAPGSIQGSPNQISRGTKSNVKN